MKLSKSTLCALFAAWLFAVAAMQAIDTASLTDRAATITAAVEAAQ